MNLIDYEIMMLILKRRKTEEQEEINKKLTRLYNEKFELKGEII